MLTPQEVQECKFDKALFGGYDMAAVDEFLDRVTEDYGALFKENALLKNKLKTLVGTVEEYRAVDEEMRRTLAAAKRTADAIIEEAKRTCEAMMTEVRQEASVLRARLESETSGEERKLRAIQKESAEFLGGLRTLLLNQVKQLDEFSENPPPPERVSRVAHVAADVAAAANRLHDNDLPAPPEPPEGDPPPEQAAPSEPPDIAPSNFARRRTDGLSPAGDLTPGGPSAENTAEVSDRPVVQSYEVTFGQGVRPIDSEDGRIPGEEPEEDTLVPQVREEFTDLRFGKEFKR